MKVASLMATRKYFTQQLIFLVKPYWVQVLNCTHIQLTIKAFIWLTLFYKLGEQICPSQFFLNIAWTCCAGVTLEFFLICTISEILGRAVPQEVMSSTCFWQAYMDFGICFNFAFVWKPLRCYANNLSDVWTW